ncbi:hypothetical protein SCACP_30360 [Sporomusa carbonis]|uniref:hypothetical protein n=1 Tax=Sporomusa carbonis TaxID=3076075 RepID=UPI003A6ADBBF
MALGTVLNKQARGYILKVCKISYPQPVGSNVLDVCLVDAGMAASPTQLEGYIKYLEERGYVTMKEAGLSLLGTTLLLVNLTAKGIDLLEGTLSDPGVCL